MALVDRIDREDLFMGIAKITALRSTCERAQVGAVLVLGNRIVSQGYAGSPPGLEHCTEVGCAIDPHTGVGCIRTIHAEANAIAYAARQGVSTVGSHMYCTHSPCLSCGKLMLSAGVTRLYYERPYRDALVLTFLRRYMDVVHKCFDLERLVGAIKSLNPTNPA